MSATRTVELAAGQRMPAIPQRPLGRDVWWWASGLRLDRVTVGSRLGRRLAGRDQVIGGGPRQLARRHGVRIRPRVTGAAGRTVTFADGAAAEFDAVVWATGFTTSHAWIDVPGVHDAQGRILHQRGVTPSPGLYVLGLTWQHTQGSALLGWVATTPASPGRSRHGQPQPRTRVRPPVALPPHRPAGRHPHDAGSSLPGDGRRSRGDYAGTAGMARTELAGRDPATPRRLPQGVGGAALSAAWLAAAGAAGVLVSGGRPTRGRRAPPRRRMAAARTVPEGRLAVAVVLGASGSVITDALGPYEVFARSPGFFVYTVSASRPTAMLSGALAAVPDYSLDDVDTGTAPEPDVVVVPAVLSRPAGQNSRCASGSPGGPAGARTCSACAPGRGCWPPRACSTATGPPRTGPGSGACSAAVRRWTGCAASATSRTGRSPPPPG